jgi:hypothetical protein
MGNDFLSAARVDEIVQESFLASGEYAAHSPLRDLLRSAVLAS